MVFDAKYYEYEGGEMRYFERPTDKKCQGVKVEGQEFEGLGIRWDQVVSHIRDLRSLCYQIMNALTIGNSRTSSTLLSSLAPWLPLSLITDSLTFGLFSKDSPGLDSTHLESLDFLLNLCSSKEVYTSFF